MKSILEKGNFLETLRIFSQTYQAAFFILSSWLLIQVELYCSVVQLHVGHLRFMAPVLLWGFP